MTRTPPLWAPWRGSYVRGETDDSAGSPAGDDHGCILCGVIADAGADRANYVLARHGGCVVILNRYPYTNGHLMIMPERHVSSFNDLADEEATAMYELLRIAESALLQRMGAEGINGGWNLGRCAGAGIEGHLHLHVLPRWSGDTNFMTAVGGTRVISQSLEDAFDILAPAFAPSGPPYGDEDEKVAEQ